MELVVPFSFRIGIPIPLGQLSMEFWLLTTRLLVSVAGDYACP